MNKPEKYAEIWENEGRIVKTWVSDRATHIKYKSGKEIVIYWPDDETSEPKTNQKQKLN